MPAVGNQAGKKTIITQLIVDDVVVPLDLVSTPVAQMRAEDARTRTHGGVKLAGIGCGMANRHHDLLLDQIFDHADRAGQFGCQRHHANRALTGILPAFHQVDRWWLTMSLGMSTTRSVDRRDERSFQMDTRKSRCRRRLQVAIIDQSV